MILNDILTVLKRKSGDKAYTAAEQSCTYEELYRFVCNLYAFLLQKNPEKRPVIVYGHKDVFMKAAFLACSFAGMAYVPVDESTPSGRAEAIITATRPGLILGDLAGASAVSAAACHEVMAQPDALGIGRIYLQPDDIAYIIFTSGSTGTPKGVKVTYRNLDSCLRWLLDITKIEKGVILNQADFSFDASVADLYLSLLTESEHFVLSAKSQMDLGLLFRQLRESGGTAAVFTPSFADLLLLDKSFDRALLPSLRLILFCGEKLTAATVKKLRARFPGIRIINCYGPTECTYAVTSHEIEKEPEITDEIPLGLSKSDGNIYIVDEDLREVPEGKVGEIVIVGASVAAGYVGNPENPAFMTYKGECAYRTGDLGYIENGLLYFKGRCDTQIKFKGYRIELSDIEKNIYALGYVEKAAVLPRRAPDGKVLSLIAFLRLREDAEKKPAEIARALKERLPAYMCPMIRLVTEFPLTKNGKCDEKMLMRSIGNVR